VLRVGVTRFEVPPNACRGERCGVWGRRAPIKSIGFLPVDDPCSGDVLRQNTQQLLRPNLLSKRPDTRLR